MSDQLSVLTDLQFKDTTVLPEKKPLIVPKLDYWSAVFSNCTCKDIAVWLSINEALPDFLGKMLLVPTATCMYFAFIYNDIKFFVPAQSLINAGIDISKKEDIKVSVFEIRFDKIKLDISGEGLIFLRFTWNQKFIGKSVDDFLRTLSLKQKFTIGLSGELLDDTLTIIPFTGECDLKNTLDGSFHNTRSDIAFDLLNYKPQFLSDIQIYLDLLRGEKVNRVLCGGCPGSFSFSTFTGSNKHTVYIGTTQSDNLLRIYDKKLQYTDENGCWKQPCPYGDVDSWIRIEIQLRDKASRKMLYQPEKSLSEWYLSVFNWIFNRYAFLDYSLYNVSNHAFKPESFWVELFDWKQITSIIQNSYFVELPVDLEKKNDKYIEEIAMGNIGFYYGRHGDLAVIYNERMKHYYKLSQSQDLSVSIPALNYIRREVQRFNSNLHGRNWDDVYPYAYKDENNLILLKT